MEEGKNTKFSIAIANTVHATLKIQYIYNSNFSFLLCIVFPARGKPVSDFSPHVCLFNYGNATQLLLLFKVVFIPESSFACYSNTFFFFFSYLPKCK